MHVLKYVVWKGQRCPPELWHERWDIIFFDTDNTSRDTFFMILNGFLKQCLWAICLSSKITWIHNFRIKSSWILMFAIRFLTKMEVLNKELLTTNSLVLESNPFLIYFLYFLDQETKDTLWGILTTMGKFFSRTGKLTPQVKCIQRLH